MYTTIIIVRFKLKNDYPTLMLIKSGGIETEKYLGPRDLESIVEFLNEKTDREQPHREKVRIRNFRKKV